MLKSINKMQNIGVFNNFIKNVSMSDFVEKNIIYGWNYSGKTTLSRVFGFLVNKDLAPDFLNAKFSITDYSGALITEDTFKNSIEDVAVFNSDFITTNLSWHGEAFQPILLLGGDSIDAEKKIEVLNEVIQRCRIGYSKKRDAIKDIEDALAEAKTVSAKQVKTNLQIVEAYTATHLNQDLSAILSRPHDHLLNASALSENTKIALTAEKDKLPPVNKISLTLHLKSVHESASKVLPKVPEFSNTIEYLKANPRIAEWVQIGLDIHLDSKVCKYCTNEIADERVLLLKSHFSKDVLDHKDSLRILDSSIANSKLVLKDVRKSDFAPSYSEAAPVLILELNSKLEQYNSCLYTLGVAVKAKIENQFDQVNLPEYDDAISENLQTAIFNLNKLIDENNASLNNFVDDKKASINKLRRHFAAQFYEDQKISLKEIKKTKLGEHQKIYEKIANKAKLQIKDLQATINRSQKGRERINIRIATMLGSEGIKIEVVSVNGEDRFQLKRRGVIAKNLSEGEKTAIAFAFFLTKLEERKKLKEVIVYIDDPISSLDSNHIFQVFSVIRSTFFEQVQNAATKEWVTSCKQIFISTHNYDFFSLLMKLPCNDKKSRYFMIKRISEETSDFFDMPNSLLKYTSEYHYLFSVIYTFHMATDKSDIELLLSLPNAVRRFLELYTYSKLPLSSQSTVDQRAEIIFGAEKSHRITKVLHHFSHLQSMDRLSANTDLISDIEVVVKEVIDHLKQDKMHFDALVSAL